MLFYNNKNLKIIYGNTAAKTNNIVPTTNLYLFSSNVPAIISKTPKNPNITGKICENKVIPVKAIFYHYYTCLLNTSPSPRDRSVTRMKYVKIK